jgi:hypothetical protein
VLDESELATALAHRPDGAAREKGEKYILRTIQAVLKKLTTPKPARVGDYRSTNEGIIWDRWTDNGVVATPLTNFSASIVSQSAKDDGLERQLAFEIEANLNGRTSVFTVPAQRFAGMHWVTENLGAAAIVHPGFSIKDHARAAIQFISGEAPSRQVYLHTGWRQLQQGWCYLHAGGAISSNGLLDEIEVELPEPLQRIRLPAPPVGDGLKAAVQASLRVLDIAHDLVTTPLLAATYRAVLRACDFSVHLAGPTGAGKTELAALGQQHFGADLDARSLPASWSSTGNSLEGLAFHAKDTVLVVDDFAPGGSAVEIARYHRQADRLLRAQGNASGRGRMTADGRLRLPRPPRGITISTGEDVPRGESLRARLFVLELGPKDLNWSVLTQCQSDARAALYAQSMSGFIRWLAPRYGEIRDDLAETITAMRMRLEERSHLRTATIEANLLVGAELFLSFAQAVHAIDARTRRELWNRIRQGVGEAAQAQEDQQRASEPTHRFLELLRSALTSGEAHVASPDGHEPDDPGAWGWRERTVGSGVSQRDEWHPDGKRIGWVDGDNLYLDLNSAHKAVQAAAGASGEGISVSASILARRLKEKGLLVVDDRSSRHLTVRPIIQGRRRRVYQLRVESLMPSGGK